MNNPIYPCLWFDGEAENAINFYANIFKDFKIISSNPVVTKFQMNGAQFMAINGGPEFKFNESISLVIDCETQSEIDYYWDALVKGGVEGHAGWLKDKFGISWQIVPTILQELMSDPVIQPKVIRAFLEMKKFNIADLKNS